MIKEYLENSCKEQKKIGLEIEHFLVDKKGNPISYEEILEVFNSVDGKEGHIEISDGVANFLCKEYTITLEPGCQFEISIAPEKELKDIYNIYNFAFDKWKNLFEKRGYKFVIKGILPNIVDDRIDIDNIKLLPKSRYKLMNDYFETSGKYGKYMMRASAAAQISVDYDSEEDAMKKLKILEILTPIISLLTDNSATENSKYMFGERLPRVTIWENVDDKRCGFIPGSLKDFSFEKYEEYVKSVPAIFVQKEDNESKYKKSDKKVEDVIDEENFGLYISLLFNYVRLKNVIEYRMADSISIERCLGLCALFKGLLYSSENINALLDYFSEIEDVSTLIEATKEIKKNGYESNIYGKDIKDIMCYLFELAEDKLGEEKKYLKYIKHPKIILNDYFKDIESNMNLHNESAHKDMKSYIENSTAYIHGHFIKALYVPKVFTKYQINIFEDAVEQMVSLENHIIDLYLNDQKVRDIFGFDKRIDSLIRKEKMYDINVPIQRIDVFFDEEKNTYRLCEINTDGTSAMNEDREIGNAVSKTLGFKNFTKKYDLKSFELFDTWIDCFVENYKETNRETMNVVIADYLDDTSMNEFEIFKSRFEKKGFKTEICDVREFIYDGSVCKTPSGMCIDAVYRRAVTSDILKKWDDSKDFIEGFKNDAFVMMGDFRTQIPHSKKFCVALHDSYVLEKLSEKEKEYIRKHIPKTYLWNSENKKLLGKMPYKKENWVLKPVDSYASKGVYLGKETYKDVWDKALEELLDKDYIIQEFTKPYRLKNIDFLYTKEEPTFKFASNMSGLYTYNGKFKGVYSRVSFDDMISSQYNELTLPTFVIKD